jgi:hypothetical protein
VGDLQAKKIQAQRAIISFIENMPFRKIKFRQSFYLKIKNFNVLKFDIHNFPDSKILCSGALL